VPLFIDRLPLQSRVVSGAAEDRRNWLALLPAIVSQWELREPPRGARPRWWKFDTGCGPDACAWRFHLESAGLDPSDPDQLAPQRRRIRAANDAVQSLPTRWATVWLVSNMLSLHHSPFPLVLRPGLPFYDRSPRRTADIFPLLGMGAFRRARLKVKIDFDAGTLSVWTPGPWYRGVSQFLRRLPGRFATIPPEQLCAPW